MKIVEFLDIITKNLPKTNGVDGIKVGDGKEELKGVGITVFPTTNVIKKCVEKGINLLIAREALTYSLDEPGEIHQISKNKIKMLEDAGITLYRLHDSVDLIEKNTSFAGFIKYLGLKGQAKYGNHTGDNFSNDIFIFDTPITAKELSKLIEEKINIGYAKISGNPYTEIKSLAFCYGIGKNMANEIEKNDAVITGELCEFFEAELTHEYALQGYKKALIILGHYGTEVLGVKLVAETLKENFKDIKIEYIECGNSYSYSNSEK